MVFFYVVGGLVLISVIIGIIRSTRTVRKVESSVGQAVSSFPGITKVKPFTSILGALFSGSISALVVSLFKVGISYPSLMGIACSVAAVRLLLPWLVRKMMGQIVSQVFWK